MSSEGVDTFSTALNPALTEATGKRFVLRYLQNLTAVEVARHHAAGLSVGVIWETTGKRALNGAASGTVDAQQALAAANKLGVPSGVPIILAECDTNITPNQIPTVAAYYKAAQAVLGAHRAWGYGGIVPARACLSLGVVGGWMQTYGWSGTPTVWDPRASIRQYLNAQRIGTTTVDLDLMVTAVPLWDPAPATPTGGQTDMPLTSADVAAIWRQPIHTAKGDVPIIQWIADMKTELDAVNAELSAIKAKLGA